MRAPPRTIMLVDDDHQRRLELASILTRGGFHVDPIADLAMAKTMLAMRTPRLLIVDAGLHNDAGFELCAYIRSEAKTRHVPVVVTAHSGTEQERARAVQAGADDYVEGSISATKLLDLVDNLLDISDVAGHLDVGADSLARGLESELKT